MQWWINKLCFGLEFICDVIRCSHGLVVEHMTRVQWVMGANIKNVNGDGKMVARNHFAPELQSSLAVNQEWANTIQDPTQGVNNNGEYKQKPRDASM